MRSFIRRVIRRLKSYRIRFFPSEKLLIETDFGFHIYLNLKKDVDADFYRGAFEYGALQFAHKVLEKGDVFIDVGANIGLYTLLASEAVGANGRVFSFEPSDWARSRLSENIQLNRCGNVSVFSSLVSDKNGIMPFHICADDAYNSIGDAPMRLVKEVRKIQSITLEQFCADRQISNVSMVKIDTEGADMLVVKGMGGVLRGERAPILLCEYNRNIVHGYEYSLDEYYQFIIGNGYQIYEVNGHSLKQFSPAESLANEIVCLKPSHLSAVRNKNIDIVGIEKSSAPLRR
jgi:FkbM family methyltransferase